MNAKLIVRLGAGLLGVALVFGLGVAVGQQTGPTETKGMKVSPPTALSPFAAAALTGGNPFRTMMITWKYTLPAFLVPFVFTLRGEGMGILLQGPIGTILWTSITAAIGVCALAVGAGGWLRRQATLLERLLAVAAGLLLMYPAARTDLAGLAGLALVLALHFWRTSLSPCCIGRHRLCRSTYQSVVLPDSSKSHIHPFWRSDTRAATFDALVGGTLVALSAPVRPTVV